MPSQPPIPNTPLVSDPSSDAIWKRWLQGLQSFLGSAVRGPGSSTDNAVARWDGTTGTLLNNSGVIIDDSNNVSGIVNLTTTGNTILGDASADTFTLNAGTITYGANWTATRAAGTLAAGLNDILTNVVSATGNASGTTSIRSNIYQLKVQGANNVNVATAFRMSMTHEGSATVAAAIGFNSSVDVSLTGNVTTAIGVQGSIALISSGNVTDGICVFASIPTLTSTGTITNLDGFNCGNLGNSKVTNAIGVRVQNFTGSTVMTGIQSELSAGSGKKNINVTGTAENYLAGDLTCDANVTLGNASADTLTINAGTWTYGANYEATRTAGVLAAGTTSLSDTRFTFSGDSGGTSTAISCNHNVTGSGSNAMVTSTGHRFFQTWNGTATLSNLIGFQSVARATNTGNVSAIAGYRSEVELSSSGSVTTATHYRAVAPSLSSSGTITTINGMLVSNQGNANITTANGLLVQDFTASTTMNAVLLELSAGSGKKNINVTGTADNYLAGRLLIGNVTTTTANAGLQLNSDGTSSPNSNVLSSRYSTDAQQGAWAFRKARGTAAAPSIVANGDRIGGVEFQAYDGATFGYGATIVSEIDGTPGAGDLPTSMYFSVAPDGSSTPTRRVKIASTGSVITNAAGSALATTATDGFLYVPTCAGTPTGAPTAVTGAAPIVIDSTNNKLYFYSGGAWRDAGP